MKKPIRLKDLMTEGNIWDRNEDGSLPTLADTMRRHAEKKDRLSETDQQDRKDIRKTLDNFHRKFKEIEASLDMDKYDDRDEFSLEISDMLSDLEYTLTRKMKDMKKRYRIVGLKSF